MPLVKESVSRHGGAVQGRGKGTEFPVRLPLNAHSLIGGVGKAGIDRLWDGRHAVPLLRPSADPERSRLEETARTAVEVVNDVEREFFGCSQRDGVIVPDHPEYWSASEEESHVLAVR